MIQAEGARAALAAGITDSEITALIADPDAIGTVTVKITTTVHRAVGAGPPEIAGADIRGYTTTMHTVDHIADWFAADAIADPATVAVAPKPTVTTRAGRVRMA